MAFSLDNLLESVVPAVISGGGTAISTILAFFRDIKKRVEELEKRVGSIEGKSGIVYSLQVIEETVKKLKENLEEREQQVVRTQRRSGSFSSEFVPWDEIRGEIQDIVKKEMERRLEDLEEKVTKLEGKIKKLVTEEDFESADRQRAAEIANVKQTMAEIKGLLQGLQSALGLIKPSNR